MHDTQPQAAKTEAARVAFDSLRSAYLRQPYIDYATRRRVLQQIEAILLENDEAICAAVSADFGNRSRHETRLLEIAPTVMAIRHSLRHLKRWMRVQRRHVSPIFFGGSNRVIPQAKGVVGIVAPWNYPLQLALSPLIGAIAAGNRVMVKMASNSQGLCRLLQRLFSERIDEDVIRILPGVGANEFSTLPYDHLVFTGSPSVGRTIMANAAKHLTPVTLELGGKSPAILAADYSLRKAAERLLFSKLINSGQMCIAPDYLFVPEDRLEQFIVEATAIARQRYGSIASDDYTSIIDRKAFDRLLASLEDARARGARIHYLLPGPGYDEANRKICPAIITGVAEEMAIMQEEIFGPFLPILTYRHIDEVLAFIHHRERPLALYLFSNDRSLESKVLASTMSGGVTINDCTMHVAQHDLPFGGVGNSGLGQYHGYEGFLEMSKLRPVFRQASKAISLAPPYGRKVDRLYAAIRRLRWLM